MRQTCMAEEKEEKKAHTKTAPVYAVKNFSGLFSMVYQSFDLWQGVIFCNGYVTFDLYLSFLLISNLISESAMMRFQP